MLAARPVRFYREIRCARAPLLIKIWVLCGMFMHGSQVWRGAEKRSFLKPIESR